MTWSCPDIKVHLRIVQQRNSFPVGQSEECSKAPKVIIQKECFVPAIFWPGLGRPGLGRFNYHLENISTTQSQSLIPGSVTRRAEELSALSLLAWKWAETNFVFKCVNCLIRILRQLRQNRQLCKLSLYYISITQGQEVAKKKRKYFLMFVYLIANFCQNERDLRWTALSTQQQTIYIYHIIYI